MTTYIHSNSLIDNILTAYPIDNTERIKQLFLGDELNIQLAIEIYKIAYPDLKIIDLRNDYEWTILAGRGIMPVDPTRTSSLKLTII